MTSVPLPESELLEIKTPLSPAAGPYGHPYHPLAVTLPIGAWTSSVIFDLLARESKEPHTYARGAADLIKTGIIGAAGAAVFGFLDYVKLPPKSTVGVTATTHMTLNVLTLLLFGVNLAQRERRLADERLRDTQPVGKGELAMSIAALGMLAASGWLGGMLSYHYGVRVADERTQRSGLEPAG